MDQTRGDQTRGGEKLLRVFQSFLVMARWEVWRKPRRSGIAVLVTALGLITIVFCQALNDGFSSQVIDTSVNLTTGHIQIMAEDFLIYDTVNRYLEDPKAIIEKVRSIEQVEVISPRVRFYGQICSKDKCWNVMAMGIVPEHEISSSYLQNSMIAGGYLSDAAADSASILVGIGLMNLLKLQVGDRVGLITKNLKGSPGVRNLRVKGVFKTFVPEVDNSLVYINKESAQRILGYDDELSEIALLLENPAETHRVISSLKELLTSENVDILSWRQLAPNLAQLIELNTSIIHLLLILVFVVVAVSTMNALLISVLERTSELGIILALGAKQRDILCMVLAQGFFISMLGILMGNAIGWGVVSYFNHYGLDLGMFERGYSLFIGGTVLYPKLQAENTLQSTLAFIVLSLLVSLYPALKAARLMPVAVIRRV